jgi:formate dehydrogenase subunit delta
MPLEKLTYMANQIGKFFAAYQEDAAISGIADHLRRFWDPRMRVAIIAYAKIDGAKLDPYVKKAVAHLESGA